MTSKPLIKRSITPQQLQEIYGIPVGTLANYRCLGKGCRYQKVGRRVLYFVEDIEDWIRSNPVLTIDSVTDAPKRRR